MSEYANYIEQSAFEDGLSVGRAEAKQRIKALQQQVERVDKLLFGMDEPLQHPVDIDGLNSLFRKLRAAIKGDDDEQV